MPPDEWLEINADLIAEEFHKRYRHFAPLFGFEAGVPWEELSQDYRDVLTACFRDMIVQGIIYVPM